MNEKRIMIVENEPVIARDIERTLKDAGYRISGIVDNGEEAIDRAVKECPDLILMDIYLKGEMDGVEAARQIRLHADIPVVYLTAYGGSELVHRSKVTEPYSYILKPFDERELQITVELALYRHDIEKGKGAKADGTAISFDLSSDAIELEGEPVFSFTTELPAQAGGGAWN